MSQTNDVDPHAPYVQELAEAGNWAALVRYWVAHGPHAPAPGTASARRTEMERDDEEQRP